MAVEYIWLQKSPERNLSGRIDRYSTECYDKENHFKEIQP